MQLEINLNLTSPSLQNAEQVESALDRATESVSKLFHGANITEIKGADLSQFSGKQFDIMSEDGNSVLGNYRILPSTTEQVAV